MTPELIAIAACIIAVACLVLVALQERRHLRDTLAAVRFALDQSDKEWRGHLGTLREAHNREQQRAERWKRTALDTTERIKAMCGKKVG